MSFAHRVREMPIVPRALVLGLCGLGVVGCVVGLIIGLRVHTSTAWFATIEVGVPAGIAGGALGLAVGCICWALQRRRR